MDTIDTQVIYKLADGSYKVYVFNSQAAGAINRRLRQYDADLAAEGSEGIFVVQPKDMAFVRAVLKNAGLLDV